MDSIWLGRLLSGGAALFTLGALSTSGYGQEQAAAPDDAAWRPSHSEVAKMKVAQPGLVNNFCLNKTGDLLVCMGGERQVPVVDQRTGRTAMTLKHEKFSVDVYSKLGKRLHSWPVPIDPQAICTDSSGNIYVGGGSQVLKLNASGMVLDRGTVLKPGTKSDKSQVTGITATQSDLFVACLSPTDYTYRVVRLTKRLKQPKQIVSGLTGCCGQMDIQARSGNVWVAHNGHHRVECYSRTGKKLSEFGREDRKAADGFGGCCEPKNLRFKAGNFVYTSESGPPMAIKRFTLSGKFLDVVAVTQTNGGCVRVTVEASDDGRTVYLLDGDTGVIHVFKKTPKVALADR